MTTTLPQQIAELKRELATRQKLYPDWVATGRLDKKTATYRVAVLKDTIQRLEELAGVQTHLTL